MSDIPGIAVDTGVSPHQIVIEITERREISDLHKASQVLAELRHRGFRVAFDDVTTDCLSPKLSADIIKIDKFLVDSIITSHPAKVVVKMLVNVGHELKMMTVAEGIETEAQVASVKCGVDQSQGYLLPRPLPISDFLDLIRSISDGSRASTDAPAKLMKQAMIA